MAHAMLHRIQRTLGRRGRGTLALRRTNFCTPASQSLGSGCTFCVRLAYPTITGQEGLERLNAWKPAPGYHLRGDLLLRGVPGDVEQARCTTTDGAVIGRPTGRCVPDQREVGARRDRLRELIHREVVAARLRLERSAARSVFLAMLGEFFRVAGGFFRGRVRYRRRFSRAGPLTRPACFDPSRTPGSKRP